MPAIIIQDVCVSNLHSKSGKIFVQINVDDTVKHKTRKSTAAPDSTVWPEQVSFDEPETAILSANVYGRRLYINYHKLRHTADTSLGELLTRTPQLVILPLLNKESQEAGTLSFSITSVPTTPTTPMISGTEAQAANLIIQASEATARESQLVPSRVGSRSTLESSEVDSSDQQCQTTSTSRTTPEPYQSPGSEAGVVTKQNRGPDLRIDTSFDGAEQFLDKHSTSSSRHRLPSRNLHPGNSAAQRGSNRKGQPTPVLAVETPKTPNIMRRIRSPASH
ncbi:hypothetical protein PAXINDRAFT_103696 [Paxillus involutus ATCC 200175]|uniref:Unplaced genomic scaffold PAXINscaffold_1512, whole genome shotgun sequence n=1 Tax=Paxillus involutus ATCC 200175 TaxID=664439 RepID=A0A0C9TEK5_PAXIN|nr:hypothetical protein PAXINDRAFT_103696 [Paxillus involutus ATCC 200175]